MEAKNENASLTAGSRRRNAWVRFCVSRVATISTDVATVAFAYMSAFALRLNFLEPSWGWGNVACAFSIAAAVYVCSLFLFGCYSKTCRTVSIRDVPRFVWASFAATAFLLATRFALSDESFRPFRTPYSVCAITFIFSCIGFVSTRVFWRIYVTSRQPCAPFIERGEKSFDNAAVARFFLGRTVMVTGAGGSIGSEIVRQAVAAGAKKTVMVERCEYALYEIDREMRKKGAAVVPVLLDVADAEGMERVFSEHSPSVVIHAAAYKHVPMVEINQEAGYKNNVLATESLAAAALAHGVDRFVLISTDKAVNPVSAMGKTKKAAEDAVMSMNGRQGGAFCAVRFGNVYGSSGSVVPLFEEQIRAGGPVTVTHPDMRRYFMTIQEAVSLVMQAASRAECAIYTLDMGESVKILDLAENMISSRGLRPYIDIPIVFTGIRPGEKIFEEIDVSEKSAYKTDMAKIYITKLPGRD